VVAKEEAAAEEEGLNKVVLAAVDENTEGENDEEDEEMRYSPIVNTLEEVLVKEDVTALPEEEVPVVMFSSLALGLNEGAGTIMNALPVSAVDEEKSEVVVDAPSLSLTQ
jgi:hypothetical protein